MYRSDLILPVVLMSTSSVDSLSTTICGLLFSLCSVQCHENMVAAIRSDEGLGMEYDADVTCAVCRAVRCLVAFICDFCVHTTSSCVLVIFSCQSADGKGNTLALAGIFSWLCLVYHGHTANYVIAR